MDGPIFIDTNVFLRFFVRDVEAQYEKAHTLFEKAEAGKIKLETSELVIAEIVWVLESFYKLENSVIGPMIKSILATPGLEVVNGTLVEKAVELYVERNIDFIDSYIVAVMERHNVSEIFSYDKKHMSRIAAIRRKEP